MDISRMMMDVEQSRFALGRTLSDIRNYYGYNHPIHRLCQDLDYLNNMQQQLLQAMIQERRNMEIVAE